ncbi:MAG: TPR domain-containing protein [Candidatus Magnetoglobus multicellularis str. Araruama]|uniref:protein O-GlcNAc transferase n=1 Tax=Candidatus Magnetoglobus multicellularis str. Araruama TaxID=890399 RepID=A0A1V1PCY0_9BACT|nr:MAG: TPR domain-containing protein [Candidatus Magnetoglobus multicellularis str. Araruama]
MVYPKSNCTETRCLFFYYHLGLLYAHQEMWQPAKKALSKSLAINPSHAESLNNLGIAYNKLKNYQTAISVFQKALIQDSSNGSIHANLASVYVAIGDLEQAQQHYMEALKYDPGSASHHRNLASVYQKRNHFIRAEYHLRQALALKPDCVDSMNDYAVNQKNQGNMKKAYQLLNQVVALKNDYWEAYSNRLFLLHYMPDQSPKQIFREHLRFGKRLSQQFYDSSNIVSAMSKTRMHIGYVSPDFRQHSVAHFVKSILCNHDTQKFDIYCYANVVQPDDVTKYFQSLNVRWRDIYDLPDKEAIKQIKNDGIDILIDLAGHSANNRMPLFAQKPAPIQMTYLGYPNTTGLSTIDYRITDSCVDPYAHAPLNTESLLYMSPCFLCYTPMIDTREIKKYTSITSGITFGSFNTLGKINDRVIQVWSTILNQLPNSRMILKARSFTDNEIQMRYQTKFLAHGVKQEQLIFQAYVASPSDHLALYQHIDIALDTFPYNGTTTTFEALWMGVPVISLLGNSHVSRVTFSILNALGLAELSGNTEADYIEKALQLAKDKQLLQYLHNHLREIMQQSPLTDGRYFTRQLEKRMSNIQPKGAI